MIWEAAVQEEEIIGVVHDDRKIGVLIIDADLHVMAAIVDRAVEGGGSVTHRRGRRRGGALAFGATPPMRASRRAASRSTNAFKACRTTADFSVTPANFCALANNSSSIAIVAFIPPAPLHQI